MGPDSHILLFLKARLSYRHQNKSNALTQPTPSLADTSIDTVEYSQLQRLSIILSKFSY